MVCFHSPDFQVLLPSFTRQSGVSQPGGMVGALGGHEGLVAAADIWQTMPRKGLVSQMCIPWEMSLSLPQAVACRVGTSVLPVLPHTGVSNLISLLLYLQRIVVKKCSRSESSIQTKSR